MSRGLTTEQVTALTSGNQFMSETFIEIYTGAGTNYYYTTGFSDVPLQTPIGNPLTTVTFLASNQISVIGNLRESYDPNGNEVTIEWSTTDNTLVSILSQKFLKTRVVLSKVFRSISTNEIVTGSKITLYDSTATALTVVGSSTDQIVQLKCQSVFRNLDNVKSRTTADIEPNGAKTITWGTIVWQ